MDFYSTTWRKYILRLRAFEQERIEIFEYVRTLSYFSVFEFLEKGTTIQKFMPLPNDSQYETKPDSEKLKELIRKSKESFKKRFNIQ